MACLMRVSDACGVLYQTIKKGMEHGGQGHSDASTVAQTGVQR